MKKDRRKNERRQNKRRKHKTILIFSKDKNNVFDFNSERRSGVDKRTGFERRIYNCSDYHMDSLKRMGMYQRINESLLRLEKSAFSFRNSDIGISTLQTIIRIEFKYLLMFLK